MISPGYPGEMPHFTRGLAAMGAQVVGLGDQPKEALPQEVRGALSAHLCVPDLWDEADVVGRVRHEARNVRFDRVECLWEPAMVLAARLREALGAPGLSVEQTVPFRDKEQMKQVLDAAGIRTPRHARASSADQVRQFAEAIGFPVIVKPIAGAGSTDTYRINSRDELEGVIPALRHVQQVSVEEFIDGDEFTFDTICSGGRILYENVAFYKPRPIEEKKHEWVSPTSICLRDLDQPELQDGRRMGRAVLEAMGFETGFSHMEWYRKWDGEVVFGEIGARPPGAYMVQAMNYASDIDLFGGWAEAVCHGRFSQPIRRMYNSAIVCKRARGAGRIQRVVGLDRLMAEHRAHIPAMDILPIGSPRRDWQRTALSDGWFIVRHPEFQATLNIAQQVAHDVQIYAG
ncbi:MAG: ATP-grasp domain-containing protein [bacterium]|nr:ATP-grasp domain-containing protein [bacterium]